MVPMFGSLARRTLHASVVALFACLVATAPAGATNTKPFSVTLSPGTVTGPGAVTITAHFTNLTSSQQLGSANLTPPSQLPVVSASVPSPGTASVVGGVVQLRNLGVAPGQSVDVTLHATAPGGCPSATYTWGVQAKQSNDFNGSPGNDLTLDAAHSSLTTTVSGPCALRFVTQPTDAQVGQHITGTAGSPTGPAVSVEIVDSSGHRVTGSTASVTMAIGSNPGGGTLSGTKTVAASAGLASFGDLSIDKPGTGYTLQASGTGLSSATSRSFNETQQATSCTEDNSCSGTLSTTSSDATVTANPDPNKPDAAVLEMSLDGGPPAPPLVCDGYTRRGVDTVSWFVTSPNRSKTVTYTINRPAIDLQGFLMGVAVQTTQFCFGAPYQFTTRSGGPATPRDYDGNGTVDEYTGLLPDCPFAGPCVLSRTGTGLLPPLGGNIKIVASIPPNALDPRGSP
jgi:hypothetical protein